MKNVAVLGTHQVVASVASVTVAAGVGLATGSDNVADLATRLGASCNDFDNNLVAGNDGAEGECTQAAVDDVDVGAAVVVVGDLDLDVLGAEGAGIVFVGLEGRGARVSPAGECGGLVFAGTEC